MLCLRSETYCYYEETSNKLKFRSKALKKWKLEQSGVATLEKYRKVLDDEVNNTALKWAFRSADHTVATYEQIKRSLLYFCPQRTKMTLEFTHSHRICNFILVWFIVCMMFAALYNFLIKLFRKFIFLLLARNQIMHEDAHFSFLQVF